MLNLTYYILCHLPSESGHGPLQTHLAEARSKLGRHIWLEGHSTFRHGSFTQGPARTWNGGMCIYRSSNITGF